MQFSLTEGVLCAHRRRKKKRCVLFCFARAIIIRMDFLFLQKDAIEGDVNERRKDGTRNRKTSIISTRAERFEKNSLKMLKGTRYESLSSGNHF